MGLFAHTDKEPHYTAPLTMPLHKYYVPSSVPMDTLQYSTPISKDAIDTI